MSTTAPDGTAELIVPPGDATFRAWKDQLDAYVSLTVAPGNTLHHDLALGVPTP